jgi:hypothetical protein
VKKSGYFAGPGFGVGAFTNTTNAARTYLRDNGDRVAFIDLYEITLRTLGPVNTATGELNPPMVLRHAAVDIDVVFEGVLYAGGGLASGWKIQRKNMRGGIGTAVESMDLTILTDGTDRLPPADGNVLTPTFGLGEAVHGGIFEGAHLTYRRLLLPRLPSYPIVPTLLDITLGATIEFVGRITEAKVARSGITLPVKSYTEQLAQPTPRNIYQATCLNSLYDKTCKVVRTGTFGGNAFQHVGALISWTPDTNTILVSATPTQPADHFTFGTIQFTSGVLCGMQFPLIKHVGALVVSMLGPPRLPAPGDSVVLQAGCDLVGLLVDPSSGAVTDGTCTTKFNNWVNFRGFPHVPPPETAL